MLLSIVIPVFVVFAAIVFGVWLVMLRRVVPTNEVHIVQRYGSTVPYGKDTGNGNTYYSWPTWIPLLGIQVTVFPVSIFPIRLESYEAYDKDRLPVVLDITGFLRIEHPNVAASRVSTFAELQSQLRAILEGATRSMLSAKDIHAIMTGRAEFGEAFTAEVDGQLKEWGVVSVKSIELMDIRDAHGSSVIKNIMEKKKSDIERDSRTVVAENRKLAEEAEIQAERQVAIAKQEALQQVGIATAEKDLKVGVANENTSQKIKDQQKTTAEKEMEIRRVEKVREAEILKDVEVVKAAEDRATDIERAEGEKTRTVLIAQGKLEAERMEAEAIQLRGAAEAESLKLKELAPVQAQITLAREIGENSSYQTYLVSIRNIEAAEVIGQAQAAAMASGELKVIANAGSPTEGITKITEMFGSSGGVKLGAMLEGLATSDAGKDIINKLTGK